MAWRVEVTAEFADWARQLRKLDRDSSRQVGAAVELLKQHGPSVKRPLVGEITTSKIKNMKELRPGSTGRSEIRILFVFDPWQQIGTSAASLPPCRQPRRYLGPSSCMQNTLRL